MKNAKTIFILISFLFVATVLYAQPFGTDQEAYQYGYDAGYHHGLEDSRMGLDFNYRHSHEFQSGISYDSYVNVNFRSGYANGYEDGYYSRTAQRRDSDYDHAYAGHDRPYSDRDRYSDRSGFVTVFRSSGFRGDQGEFQVGRYPDLHGRWNDSIESIQLSGPVRVILFDETDFRGPRLVVEEDAPDLHEFRFASRAASMIVEPMR